MYGMTSTTEREKRRHELEREKKTIDLSRLQQSLETAP